MKSHPKSLLKLLSLSELIVNLGPSKIYYRLVSVLYSLTLVLLLDSSAYWIFKALGVLLILALYKKDREHKRPFIELQSIQFKCSNWSLCLKNGTEDSYEQLTILLHNPLFQCIKLAAPKKNKLIILFNDQLTSDQWRFIHLQSGFCSI
jgi:hypothetical protein